MGRISVLTEKSLTGAEFVVNASGDEAGFVPASALATAAQGALADSAVQPGDTSAATSKTTPVDADEMPIQDSAAAFALKKLTWANLKATVKTYFDTLYQPVDGDLTAIGGLSPTNDDVIQRKAGAWTNRTLAELKTDLSLQPADQDLTDIAALTPTNDDFLQRKAGAWANRTPTQATADLIAMVADSGTGGAKGLVPAPAAGDAAAGKFLKADATWAVPAGGGSTDIPAEIHAATEKTTPVDADELALVDSAASWALKKLTWANLKATAKTYFDTLYQVTDADLTAIAGLSPTNDDIIQRKTGAWINRTMAQLLADLAAFVGDSGAGGTKGLVPAPASGDAAASKFLKADGTWAAPSGSGDTFGTQLLHVADEKTSGTAGGSASATTWNARTLNTVRTNEISGASLASNAITLPAGTYYIEARAPGYQTSNHKLRLYNVTDAASVLTGTSERSTTTDGVTNQSHLVGRFTLAAEKNLRLEHYTAAAAASTGLGQPVSAGVVEIYAEAMIWKVA